MKQASKHVVLMYFTHERIKAYGSQCFTQVSRLISGISGCRTQISCLLVLCLLHNVTVLQVDPKLKHCSVDSFLVVGYKWYIILITYAYFQRKGFTLILCQCYFNVWHYIAGCILLHEKILGKNVCLYLFLQIYSNLRNHDDWKPTLQNNLE